MEQTGNTRHHTKRVTNREEFIEECKFMARFEPLFLERAKAICDALEGSQLKYPFLRRIMKEEGEAMLKEMRKERIDKEFRGWASV